jgi:hypothetical protein
MKVRPAPMPARADVGAYAACAWSLAFAAVHLNWALGGTALLPLGMSVGMNPALFVIDVIAVPLCLLGALLALSFVRPWGRAFPRRALLACGWGVCAILVLHSAPTLVRGALVAVGLLDADLSVLERWSLFVYEPWFFTGGLLYGLSAWCYGRRSRTAVVTESKTPGTSNRGGEPPPTTSVCRSSEGNLAEADRDRRQGGHRK